jgi:hypothetical protein
MIAPPLNDTGEFGLDQRIPVWFLAPSVRRIQGDRRQSKARYSKSHAPRTPYPAAESKRNCRQRDEPL